MSGLMALALLGTLLVQTLSGLLATRDLMIKAPLAHLLTAAALSQSYDWRRWGSILLLGLIVMHLLAVVLHWLVFKDNLVRPMLTGRKLAASSLRDVSFVSPLRALIVLG
ncbi:hypothetical protein [Variovorax sp. YR566]|nr:hypothetical protein [Variovorax sp. YR752]